MTDYLNELKGIISGKTGVDPDEIHEQAYLEDDLNIDELELLDILTDLEDTYNIDLTEDKDSIETVQDLMDILSEKAD